MKLSKKRAAEIQLLIEVATEAQHAFWDASLELECLTDREIDGHSDMEGWGVEDFFNTMTKKRDGGEFKGEVIVPDFKAQYDKLIAARELGLPCTCAERSWYGEEHDSACERTGKR